MIVLFVFYLPFFKLKFELNFDLIELEDVYNIRKTTEKNIGKKMKI